VIGSTHPLLLSWTLPHEEDRNVASNGDEIPERMFRSGDYVRIAAGWRDGPDETDAVYVVVEDNGDRLIVELVCDLPIRPQEIVRPYMIEPADRSIAARAEP